jgi:hypothetical protein
VIWEIEIEADSPVEAAQEARAVQMRPDLSATLFDVWEHRAAKMHRVDLVGQADRLDRTELVAIRACQRLLECTPSVYANIKELAAAMLIFLDREDMMFKWSGRGLSR